MHHQTLFTHLQEKKPDGIQVTAAVERDSTQLILEFVITYPVGRVKIPPLKETQPGREDELWKTTCFELFFRRKGSTTYRELNFSPRGDWNVYSFTGYREGMQPESRVREVQLESLIITDTACRCRFHLAVDSVALHDQPLEYSLTAVVEETDGTISHWALGHAGERPDFHLSESLIGNL